MNKLKELIPYMIIILIAITIRTFIITPVIVKGDSMKPTLKNNEVLLNRKIGYNEKTIKRFDIVVVKNEDDEIIKRVIGLPGEHISYKSDKLYVNDKLIEENYSHRHTTDFNLEEICSCTKIPEGKYLVLGDNRPISKDSRIIGLIDKEDIIGKTGVRIFPFSKIGNIYKKN